MISKDELLSSGIFNFPVFPLVEKPENRGHGNNEKQILVCSPAITGTDAKDFLEKVMASVGVVLGTDTFLVPVEEKELFRFSDLDHALGFEKALFFGIPPEQAGLNLNAQKYQPLSFAKKTFLFADSLEMIQQKADLKRPLWEALKIMFK